MLNLFSNTFNVSSVKLLIWKKKSILFSIITDWLPGYPLLIFSAYSSAVLVIKCLIYANLYIGCLRKLGELVISPKELHNFISLLGLWNDWLGIKTGLVKFPLIIDLAHLLSSIL